VRGLHSQALKRVQIAPQSELISDRAFSHDFTAAILVFQNNGTAAMLVYPENRLGVELFSYVKTFFCSNKLA